MNSENNISEYDKILNKLLLVCDFVLIGSMGLKYAYPDIMESEPKDADIVISDKSDLRSVVKFFIENGYDVYSWNELIDKNFDYSRMEGRIYFRAMKGSYQFDVNYDLENITYSEISKNIKIVNNIKVPTRKLFIRLLNDADNDKYRIVIERLNKMCNN